MSVGGRGRVRDGRGDAGCSRDGLSLRSGDGTRSRHWRSRSWRLRRGRCICRCTQIGQFVASGNIVGANGFRGCWFGSFGLQGRNVRCPYRNIVGALQKSLSVIGTCDPLLGRTHHWCGGFPFEGFLIVSYTITNVSDNWEQEVYTSQPEYLEPPAALTRFMMKSSSRSASLRAWMVR